MYTRCYYYLILCVLTLILWFYISFQLLLLTAVKDVANALKDLIESTRNASGKSVQDPAMEKLKTSAKVLKIMF